MGRKVFIATKVDGEVAQERSAAILTMLRELGYDVFLPVKRPDATAVEILESNERECAAADALLCVFDGAGAGVAMELGRAHALGKDIVGFRTPESVANEYLGKMLDGFWQRLPDERKATGLDDLHRILEGLKAETRREEALASA